MVRDLRDPLGMILFFAVQAPALTKVGDPVWSMEHSYAVHLSLCTVWGGSPLVQSAEYGAVGYSGWRLGS